MSVFISYYDSTEIIENQYGIGSYRSFTRPMNRIIPVSTLLEGEYGERDVYAGVPTVLNRSGAYDVLEIHMTPGELARFKESTRVIREYTDRIMKLNL